MACMSHTLTACTVRFRSISFYAWRLRSENQASALSVSRLADSCLQGLRWIELVACTSHMLTPCTRRFQRTSFDTRRKFGERQVSLS